MTPKKRLSLKTLKENPLLQNKVFTSIMFISVFVYTSIITIMITLPKFADDLGATSQEIGLLAGAFALSAFIMRPFSGHIVDRGNKLLILRIVFVILFLVAIALTQATEYWMLLILWGLNGFVWSVGSTLFMTIATSCIPAENMTTGIGIYSMGLTVALTIAPLFALPVAEQYGYNNLYKINVVLILISFALSFILKIEPQKQETKTEPFNIKNVLHPPALLPTSITMANTISRATITAFLVIFAGTLGIENVAIYFTIRAIMLFFFRPVAGKLSEQYGSKTVLIICEVLTVAAMIVISQAHSLIYFILAAVLVGLGEAGHQPILLAECILTAEVSSRGKASSTNYLGIDIGNFVGSNLAGFLVATVGYRSMYAFVTLPIIITTVFYLIRKGKMQDSEQA